MRAPCALLLVLGLTGLAGAQLEPTDPRFERDPRDGGDPRAAKDPREVEAKQAALERGDPELLETRELFDSLWAAERYDELSRAMQQRPWEVLAYLDRHARAWQLLARNGEPSQADADAQAETLRGLAELADRGIVDSHFSGWTDSLLAWGPEEHATAGEARALVGEAGALLRNAVDENDLLAALTPLHQAAERSRTLGDVPAHARTLLSLATVQISNGMAFDARLTAEEATRLARLVRDLDTTWTGLTLCYDSALIDQEPDVAREALQSQYQVALEVGDEVVSEEVLRRLIDLDNLIAGDPTTVWMPKGRTGLLWQPGSQLKLRLGNR